MDFSAYDRRPILVAVAGPNGAGKTTFFHAHLAAAGLHFVNADVLATELDLPPYQAARVADALRRELVKRGESFVFETVFSDPVGDKVGFLEGAAQRGYIVVLCYIGLAGADPIGRARRHAGVTGRSRRSRREAGGAVSANARQSAIGNPALAARTHLRQQRPGRAVSPGRRLRARPPASRARTCPRMAAAVD